MSETKETPIDSTHLSDDELRYFKEKLQSEENKTKKKIEELKDRLDSINRNAGDNQSAQDHHVGDLGTTENQKTTLLTSLENQQEKLDQIIVALDRIDSGNYGICIETGRPIQKERLEAVPYALKSVKGKG